MSTNKQTTMTTLFKILLGMGLLYGNALSAQVGIGTTNPNASSILDVSSTNKGILFPRMLQADRTAISTPATGLLVYQTDGATGWWYYNGTQWTRLENQPQASTTYMGWVTMGDVAYGTTIADVGGFVVAADKTNTSYKTTLTVTHNLGLTGNQSIQATFLGLSSNTDWDNAVFTPLIFNITANSFQVFVEETSAVTQNLRLMFHLVNY
jgi:hypothetical protein